MSTTTPDAPAIDYDALARAINDQPENDIDAEISGPGWETLLECVPARGSCPTAERAAKVAGLRHFAAVNVRSAQQAADRAGAAQAKRADVEADLQAIEAYRAAYVEYRAAVRANPTGQHVRPTRPALRTLTSDELVRIENSNNSGGGAARDNTVRDPAGLEQARRGW